MDSDAPPLFVYGTLCDPDLLAAVLGRPVGREAAIGAAAPGHKAVHYPARIYPALVRVPGAAAPGLLLLGLSPFELDVLDAYEGPEYRRGFLPVMVGEELHEALAYLPTGAIPADAVPWTLEGWQRRHKAGILVAERASAEELRQRLLALRPN